MPPLVRPDCRVLILGSLPGAASLAQAQYYAHPRNQFWPIIGDLTGVDLIQLDYAARIAAINRRGIGLWDCIASAERQGSLDGAIRSPEHNSLEAFVNGLPHLLAVAFNGAKAAKIGLQQLGPLSSFERLILPSTSPAYTAPMLQKLAAWSALARFIASSESAEPQAVSGV